MRLKRKKPINKKPVAYAFIDSQNLNLGIQKAGWKMDWRKFRAFLEKNYNVKQAYMFIGYMPENESLYEQMHDLGYSVVLKPTVDVNAYTEQLKAEAIAKGEKPPAEVPKQATKGNVDADLVLYAMKELPNYDKAVIVSGDGDFFGLIEYLDQEGRLLNVLTPNWQYSSLLKPFEKHIVRLDQLKSELRYFDYRKKSKLSK
jgi:uncharacterized LabA/DUF88 family protein